MSGGTEPSGGGGGGGYYGGGGGEAGVVSTLDAVGGGGGSSYVGGLTATSLTQGYRNGNGVITLTYTLPSIQQAIIIA